MSAAIAGQRLVIVDDTHKHLWQGLGLSHLWGTGARVAKALGWFDEVLSVSSWGEAYKAVARARLQGPVRALQVWGHGMSGAPLLNNRPVNLHALGAALRADPTTEVWWRSCEVARGEQGQRFMADAVQVLGCKVAGHCAVISAPNPMVQAELCGLRPGEAPWWPLNGDGLRGCSTLKMKVPKWAWKPEGR